MSLEKKAFKLLKALQVHLSEDNPFIGSDNPETVAQLDRMEAAATAAKALLLNLNISPEMRAKVEKMNSTY